LTDEFAGVDSAEIDNDGRRLRNARGQSNLTTGRIAAAHGWFNGIRQVAPVSSPT